MHLNAEMVRVVFVHQFERCRTAREQFGEDVLEIGIDPFEGQVELLLHAFVDGGDDALERPTRGLHVFDLRGHELEAFLHSLVLFGSR